MPMGLHNISVTFPSLLIAIFSECIDMFLVHVVYSHDKIIFFRNTVKERLEHLEGLERVLVRVKEN